MSSRLFIPNVKTSGIQFLCHVVSAVQLKKNKSWASIKKKKKETKNHHSKITAFSTN